MTAIRKHAISSNENETDETQEIAEYYDRQARKDATLNMRISSSMLDEIKVAASQAGFDKYQQWVHMTLEDALRESQGLFVQKF